MVFSDKDIKEAINNGIIGIDPYFEKDVQPASVDLHLDKKLLIFNNSSAPFIDLKKELPDLNEPIIIQGDEPFIIHPGDFVLGSTLEKITIPNNMVARIEGKSSLGRLGLLIHSTAGFVDPGFSGNLTLELANVSRLPITLYYGMRIGQISFQKMISEAEKPYGSPELKSRYQGQLDPTESRVFEDFEKQISKKE
ncbi:MAG: dCTP deaminase [Chloroflexi bacterium]|nr:dCTP deaminase [Chloroflexota bacterium]|tara:strand:- start:3170 stop:3754 length:585 start_codon:yes stop_codon:yes gene_type:complete